MGFIFGAGTGETAESLARKREMLEAMGASNLRHAPQNVGEGLSAIGQALAYRFGMKKLEKKEATGRDSANSAVARALGLYGADSPYTTAAPGAGATTGGSTASGMDGNQIYSEFMDTVKKGGVDNPYALAAIAATGKAESGFSPGNVYRQWSDPSQSGDPGQAGGIMSWRAQRLDNLRKFAADNGGDSNRPSPAIQAQFLLHEDPSLIDALKGAKSAEEAQQLMNNAWKFAGYNQPGGEAARRMALANGFASQFAGQSDPTRVASLDPAAGIAAALGGRGSPDPAGVPGNAVAEALGGKPIKTAQATGGTPVDTGNGNLNALMEAATNPFLTQQQRALVNMLIEKEMGNRDPARKLALEKAQLEIGALKNPTDWKKLDDGRLYNERTGEVKDVPGNAAGDLFDGKSVDGQALNYLVKAGRLTREQAAEIAAGKTITDPATGAIIFLTPSGIFAQPAQGGPPMPIAPEGGGAAPDPAVAAGAPAVAAGGAVAVPSPAPAPVDPAARSGMIPLTDAKPAKAPTEQQLRNRQLYSVVEPELKIVQDNFKSLTELSNQAGGMLPKVGNYATSPEYQRASNSLRTIIATYLYSTSGATANPAEVENQALILTPQLGESKDSIADKQRRIETMVEAIKLATGDRPKTDTGSDLKKKYGLD